MAVINNNTVNNNTWYFDHKQMGGVIARTTQS